jgi:hypothetical protein
MSKKKDDPLIFLNTTGGSLMGYMISFVGDEETTSPILVSNGHELDLVLRGWLLGVKDDV